ncbi:MAG: ABC transporter permease [Zetaproteobacteria bacterium]|nr:ABC transporter permease [Zetaproteobacteria bacterium]
MTLLRIAKKSLLNRKGTTFLTVLSVGLSVTLLLGIERVRTGARQSFESTISGVDLIAGARSGPINLLLFSVFRLGNAVHNISYASFEKLKNHEQVEWAIPISLGDSHRGFRVVGTHQDYFKYYQFAGDQQLTLDQGKPFAGLFETVLGFDVAAKLKYRVGDTITLSHGMGVVSFQDHGDKPFTVVGILAKTGTPVDQSVHVSLEAIQALHLDWQDGAPPLDGDQLSPAALLKMQLAPSDITAFFVKLKSRISIFEVQREINNYEEEALMAIIPGVILRELWNLVGVAEQALWVVSVLVFFVSLIGVMTSMLAALNERRREMAILRSIGAKKSFVFTVLMTESLIITLFGELLGVSALYFVLMVFGSALESQVGLSLRLFAPTSRDVVYLITILVASLLASTIPAWVAYKNSLADGLTIKN